MKAFRNCATNDEIGLITSMQALNMSYENILGSIKGSCNHKEKFYKLCSI